ncbi:unnamed protein product, partial [Prorocentrum cordatum]
GPERRDADGRPDAEGPGAQLPRRPSRDSAESEGEEDEEPASPLSPLSPRRQRQPRPRTQKPAARPCARRAAGRLVAGGGCRAAVGHLGHGVLSWAVLAMTLGVLLVVAATGGRGIQTQCVLSERRVPRASHLSPEDVAMYTRWEVSLHLVGVLVTAPVAFLLRRILTTSHLRRVSEYALLQWLQQWTGLVAYWMQCAGGYEGLDLLRLANRWIYNLSIIASFGYFWWILRLQLLMLEHSSFIPMRAHWLWRMIMATMLVGLYVAATFTMTDSSLGAKGSPIRVTTGLAMWLVQLLMASALLVFLHGLWRIASLTQEARNHTVAVGMQDEEGQNAPRSLRFQMFGSAVCVLSTSLSLLGKYWATDLLWPIPAPSDRIRTPQFLIASFLSLALFDVIANTTPSLALSGVFFGALSGGRQCVHAEQVRRATWRRSSERWVPHPEPRWQAKVGRGDMGGGSACRRWWTSTADSGATPCATSTRGDTPRRTLSVGRSSR